ncbi:gamma-type small acid-soluble spore protein [Pullulanibacillus sp. KACC 23026]|uniref:gamma-type small acid-soluble spore protein n=1 Tax=Pullulanibacillus sp. KACC 23026 TaxID=3028315 RepID=UPI0023B1DFBA|nr:gamma-type small acid-soluble spore protein [Pullulanibacillus sp. KACC 23026]WEG11310.1 gamma-type small acid-soluble spore protein [Pullulanibacillus sp. KACC 23026]
MTDKQNKRYTIVGTDIDEVKEKNAHSGLSYNEVKALIAREKLGFEPSKHSDTDS